MLEEKILHDISSGHYRSGDAIPSRNRLAAKYNCSRTTVEHAVDSLKKRGILISNQGGSTRVARPPGSLLPENTLDVYIIAGGLEVYSEQAIRNMFLPGLEDQIQIHPLSDEALLQYMDKLTRPGVALVWIMPPAESLWYIRFFKLRNVPQLLINRDYGEYDYVCTDILPSLRDGLSWLMIEAGRDLVVISREPVMKQPYLAERLNAFYECSVALGARLRSDRIYIRPFQDIPGEMSKVGLMLFSSANPPRGIVVLENSLPLPLVTCGQIYGKKPGRDYFLLTFDYIAELKNYPGVGMMRQQDEKLFLETKRWILDGYFRRNQPFRSRIKTELILPENKS